MNMGLINRSYESDQVCPPTDKNDHEGDAAKSDCLKMESLVTEGDSTLIMKRESSEPMTQWQRFGRFVEYLNDQSATDKDRWTRYVVIYMGRHGEGYHNVAERMYGTKDWNVRF